MKLEDLKRYEEVIRYGESFVECHSEGMYLLHSDVQSLNTAHKQREAELLELLMVARKKLLDYCPTSNHACEIVEHIDTTLKVKL